MRNLLLPLLLITVLLSSCLKDQEFTVPEKGTPLGEQATDFTGILLDGVNTSAVFEKEFNGQTAQLDGKVALASAALSTDVSFTYEILPSSNVTVGNEITSTGSGVIAAGTVSAGIPIMVNLDNLTPSNVYNVDIQLATASVDIINQSKVVSYTFQLECTSELAGTLSYVLEDNFTGEVLTGSIDLITDTEGVYLMSDFSFGSWEEAYGEDPPRGDLRINHICGELFYTGFDNFSESWKVEEVLASDGPVLKYRYTNTYGEFGVVSLTRADGADWPNIR